MPFRLNDQCRCRIQRQKHKVINSAGYDAALHERESRTVWFTEEAIAGWRAEPRVTPGGQPLSASLTSIRGIAPRGYPPPAILTALTPKALFRLAPRRTENLIGSFIGLLGLELRVQDHSTLSRRAKTLEAPRPQPRRDGGPTHLFLLSTGLKLGGAGEAGQGSAWIVSGIPAEGSGWPRSTAP